jgi:hypothetical protein
MRVPPPGGLSTVRVPSSAVTRSTSPESPPPGSGWAPPARSSSDGLRVAFGIVLASLVDSQERALELVQPVAENP